ncbi:MAG: hypothetical protein Q8T13_09775 [Acidobacteriota bacterium]|nr:hypothetical protein [Acidobacteriota bacterium]
MTIYWTERAQDDVAAIHAFIEADSTHDPSEIHVLTVHHGARETLGAV